MSSADERFIARLKEGYRNQLDVALMLLAHGLIVQTQPLYVREKYGEEGASDEFDLLFRPSWRHKVYAYHAEVKSRASVKFTGVSDYPYPTVFIESPRSNARRTAATTPDYFINYCPATESAIVLHVASTKQYWGVDVRGNSQYVSCPKELWVNLDEEWIGGLT